MTTLITKKEWLEIFPEAVLYLEDDLNFQFEKYDKQVKEMKLQIDMVEKFVSPESRWFHELVMNHFIEADIKQTEKRIKEIDQYLRKDVPTNWITDQDIERAKEYPFNQLIEFKHDFAICPFHNEKTPSLHWNKKNNTIHCFGCSKNWDTIQFLRETEGLDFISSVKYLK